jgi:amino acid adenylation domain-containing protein
MLIPEFFDQSARLWPHSPAIEEESAEAASYRDLAELSDRVRDRLRHAGVSRGARVGICLRKSIDAVAAILGALKTGAAYVPVDPGAPAARNAYILNDCSVSAVIIETSFEPGLRAEMAPAEASPAWVIVDGVGGGRPLRHGLERLQETDPAPAAETAAVSPDDLAYILYTSGSTGKPKGVMLSHRNAAAFIDWCSEAFEPRADDRFSSHAPLHFDLSILDLYVPLKHGATVVLIGAETGKDPARLAALMAEKRITCWYSTPTILSLLGQYGRLGQHDYSALRSVLFAGEVFPVKHLRRLQAQLPEPRYFNLYGPTETNVCTYYEIPREIPEERSKPFPIGKVCSHLQARVVDEQGQTASEGAEGELCISGPGVMQGYWNLPERTAQAFLVDGAGRRWYRTGDIVTQEADGNLVYIGRRDRMVKKRGYRVELGEIEAGLYRHPAVKEAAAVAFSDDESGVRILAVLSCKEPASRPTIIELKRFCADHLPAYMVPDQFVFWESLPKTSTDKIDYQKLQEARN